MPRSDSDESYSASDGGSDDSSASDLDEEFEMSDSKTESESEKTEDEDEDDEQIEDMVHPDEIEAIEQAHQELIPIDLDVEEIQKNKYRRIPKEERVDNGHVLPPVSAAHLELIERLKEDREIRTPEVYEIMKSVDFTWFYKELTEEWAVTNARMLESAIAVLKPGQDILSFPLNMYFNVCCALIVGYQGSVLCFGHSVNINMLKRSGLDWLEKEDRLRFSYEDLNMSYGSTYSEFIEVGFPYREPYDLVLLATMMDAVITPEVARQLKPGGVCYQPSSCSFVDTTGVIKDEPEDVEEPEALEEPEAPVCQDIVQHNRQEATQAVTQEVKRESSEEYPQDMKQVANDEMRRDILQGEKQVVEDTKRDPNQGMEQIQMHVRQVPHDLVQDAKQEPMPLDFVRVQQEPPVTHQPNQSQPLEQLQFEQPTILIKEDNFETHQPLT